MNGGLERVQQGCATLKPAEKRVAIYILNHHEKVLMMPIKQLAKKCQTSEATVIRMCRSLQFRGYRELKISISASTAKPQDLNERYRDLTSDAGVGEIVRVISNNNLRSIEATISVIDEATIEQAVDVLSIARKIMVIGVGASAIVALDFEQKCQRINRWCEALIDSHAQLTSAVHLTPEDVVIAVSYSGETAEIIETLNIARNNHAKIISITCYGKNQVQKLADINLYVSALEQSVRSGATASRIAQLTIIDILFMSLASKNYTQSIDYLERTREAIQTRFKK